MTRKTISRSACLAFSLFAFACKPPKLDTYEKNRDIPQSSWESSLKPTYEVTLNNEDTAYFYNLYVNVRHTDAYPYNNLWLIVSTQLPGDSLPQSRRVELPLADSYGKWLGNGLDDIFEHRIPIQQNAILPRTGTYRFTFEQNMRQDPLPNIMSVGLRVEKTAPRK
ncbi:gliding motility lipoprotein GldH [Chitinophaga deserti]|uniref:gliding motility lipoprotein GldH n=1 Tax=Chitinophaga deserti TaxID=2164099 RepID=UPI000D6D8DE2|nr:gliding motility lipoprotein GldH [Chitinophaga deserti]